MIRASGVAVATALFLTLARPAAAQLTTAEVYQRIDMAVQAAQNAGAGGGASDSFKLPPTTIPVTGSGSESLPLTTLQVTKGGNANASAYVAWTIAPTGISASAQFTATTNASGQDSASAGFDQSFRISYQVSEPTTYRIDGSIRTVSDLEGNERLVCTSNQRPLAGADPTTIPRDTAVPFADAGTVYPLETASIECSVIGGAALVDSTDQSWTFTVALTPLSTTPTTLPPTVSRKECRQACRQARKACKAACTGTGRARRLCKRDCKQRAKLCDLTTGCALP